MGFISKLRARRAAKKGQDPSKANETVLANDDIDSIVNSSSSASCASNGDSGFKKKLKKLSSFAVTDVTMDHLPDLVLELETSRDTSSKQSGRALKMLFALSEPAASQTRIDMVAREEGRLVSALLNFLVRCSRKSSEQYLTLLVLNNISIPTESKRVSSLLPLSFTSPNVIIARLRILSMPCFSLGRCYDVWWREGLVRTLI